MKATEVRILNDQGGIVRWEGEAADIVAKVLSAIAEKALEGGKPLPTPSVIRAGDVERKVTVLEGRISANVLSGDGCQIIPSDGRVSYSLLSVLPLDLLETKSIEDGDEWFVRIEVEASPANQVHAGAPKGRRQPS